MPKRWISRKSQSPQIGSVIPATLNRRPVERFVGSQSPQIGSVIPAQMDPFWRNNILSPSQSPQIGSVIPAGRTSFRTRCCEVAIPSNRVSHSGNSTQLRTWCTFRSQSPQIGSVIPA